FRAHRAAIERLHQIFVGARMHDMGDGVGVAFGGGDDDHRAVAALLAAHAFEEIDAAHAGQVAVEQDDVGHFFMTDAQGAHAVFRFGDVELHFLEDLARHGAQHPAVVDDQAVHAHGAILPARAPETGTR